MIGKVIPGLGVQHWKQVAVCCNGQIPKKLGWSTLLRSSWTAKSWRTYSTFGAPSLRTGRRSPSSWSSPRSSWGCFSFWWACGSVKRCQFISTHFRMTDKRFQLLFFSCWNMDPGRSVRSAETWSWRRTLPWYIVKLMLWKQWCRLWFVDMMGPNAEILVLFISWYHHPCILTYQKQSRR